MILSQIIMCTVIVLILCAVYCCFRLVESPNKELGMYWCRHGFYLIITAELLRLIGDVILK